MAQPTRLTILPDDLTITVQPGETLLDAMRAAGLGCRFACRRGGCAFCKVDIHEGEVDYEYDIASSVMSDEEYANGTCLACRAVPKGDVSIELRDERLLVKSSMLLKMRQVAKAEAEDATDA
ncbi:2Fe-2S iron-sulfur cluster-binding protein [Enemella sp. A6]|uniref:2Fe-2S iron-sulfur cluster-binding protein n=1 Tax=Enemella sp. A6 TaxID=3440152 RepID=UPI003EC0FDA9